MNIDHSLTIFDIYLTIQTSTWVTHMLERDQIGKGKSKSYLRHVKYRYSQRDGKQWVIVFVILVELYITEVNHGHQESMTPWPKIANMRRWQNATLYVPSYCQTCPLICIPFLDLHIKLKLAKKYLFIPGY